MDDPERRFHLPVSVRAGGSAVVVSNVDEALKILMDVDWPERGARHDEAVAICHKVADGHRSVSEARKALIAAASEAGVLIGH